AVALIMVSFAPQTQVANNYLICFYPLTYFLNFLRL
ncbi:MAG: hypothetical protein JWQ85_3939, partial [Mucilaginibacter sp.]|nr:hypothetical protein [Mucilaginibacter sp.]